MKSIDKKEYLEEGGNDRGCLYPKKTFGVRIEKEYLIFSIVITDASDCDLLLFKPKSANAEAYVRMNSEKNLSSIFYARISLSKLKKDHPSLFNTLGEPSFEYLYRTGKAVFVDPYAQLVHGRPTFGKKLTIKEKSLIRGYFHENGFNWQNDKHPLISYNRAIIYKIHVRGLTKLDQSIMHKGTYLGVIEKIPYLKKLGINTLFALPCVEFDEIMGGENRVYGAPKDQENITADYQGYASASVPARVNYWGFTDRCSYFAPKASYAFDRDHADDEFKQMIRSLHENGIEFIMEMNFMGGESQSFIMECLHFWVMEYHVDGFGVNTDVVPESFIATDPFLSGTKLYSFKGFNTMKDYGMDRKPIYINLADNGNNFETVVRRYMKGDEGQIGNFIMAFTKQNSSQGVINYVTDNNGFTLHDLYSYDIKHNDLNGEEGHDGTDFNFSWNCGQEGVSKSKKIGKLRSKMFKNILLTLFLAQGAPMLLSGDEYGNGQDGNNNAYCQDNKIGWVSWKKKKNNDELLDFTSRLIAFRKMHPVFSNINMLKGMDSLSCGCPDISFHGTRAWYTDYSNYSRCLGIMLCGEYAKKDETSRDDSFYLAFNMHWEQHEFDLPLVSENMAWRLIINTEEDDDTLKPKGENILSRKYMVPARSIVILEAVKLPVKSAALINGEMADK